MSAHYFNPQEMINKTIIFDGRPAVSVASSFHVAYDTNQNFLFGCGISATSVLLHNNDASFAFHVFINGIPKADIQCLSQLAKSYRTCIQIHLMNYERFKMLPTTKNWSTAMYFRFVIADYFTGQQDKILYLGADIARQGNLKPLITIDLANSVTAVVTKRDADWWSLRAQSLRCSEPKKGHFNSGALLINTLAWAQESVSTKVMSIPVSEAVVSRLTYMDQDILDLILLGKVKFIDAKYSTQFSLDYELKKSSICLINDETVLTHYVGPTEPWHYWAGYPSAQPFIKDKEASPWENEPLMRPINSNYTRYCARHNFKQNKPINGIMNYIYYFYLKIAKWH